MDMVSAINVNPNVILGARENLLAISFLAQYREHAGVDHFKSLKLEKLLVIFFKHCIARSVFEQSITNTAGQVSLKVKYYLHGPVLEASNLDYRINQFYLADYKQTYSSYLVSNKYLEKDRSHGYKPNRLGVPNDSAAIDSCHSLTARQLGTVLAEVIEKQKLISLNELVVLAVSNSSNDVLGALFAELVIIKRDWSKSRQCIEKNRLRNESVFAAANSGWFKLKSFLEGSAHEVITRVARHLKDPVLQSAWMSVWSNSSVDPKLTDIDTLASISRYGSTIIKMNILLRLISFREHKSIENCVDDFNKFLRSCENLPVRGLPDIAKDQLSDYCGFLTVLAPQINTNWLSSHQAGLIEMAGNIIESINDQDVAIGNDAISGRAARKGVANSHKPKATVHSNELHVLVASPGDTVEEREYLLDKLERKYRNDGLEKASGKRLIILGWEDVASQDGYPQDIINKQLLWRVDIVLAVLKHKLGTPTKSPNGEIRAESGTVEELLFALETGNSTPVGMAYFYERAPIVSLEDDTFDAIKQEWDRLKKFKRKVQDQILYRSYSTKEDLLQKCCVDIYKNASNLFA